MNRIRCKLGSTCLCLGSQSTDTEVGEDMKDGTYCRVPSEGPGQLVLKKRKLSDGFQSIFKGQVRAGWYHIINPQASGRSGAYVLMIVK